jgi:hypothetical protein
LVDVVLWTVGLRIRKANIDLQGRWQLGNSCSSNRKGTNPNRIRVEEETVTIVIEANLDPCIAVQVRLGKRVEGLVDVQDLEVMSWGCFANEMTEDVVEDLRRKRL